MYPRLVRRRVGRPQLPAFPGFPTLRAWPALLAAAALAACSGGGEEGSTASNASSTGGQARALNVSVAASGRVSVSTEPAGSACPSGGNKVSAWYDANANGTLDEGETASVGYVCNGAAGAAGAKSLVRTAPEAPGARCANGGTRVDAGLDSNGNGTLEEGEITSTSQVCNGIDGAPAVASLFALSAEPAGSSCAQGGTRIQTGADRNGNGALDSDEVSGGSVVCSGAAGSAGVSSLVGVATEAAGANCAAGGTAITTGLDANGNGVLDSSEATSTRYVCGGTAGATGSTGATGADGRGSLATATAEAAGAQCSAGGVKLSVGTDIDGNGLLDAPEVSAARYLCNGEAGSAGRASLSAISAETAGANCAAGGSRITSGPDNNANGVLDAAEVASTTYACNGATGSSGSNGANGFSSLVAVASEAAGGNCSAGGSRITAGLDANRNNLLEAGEVTSTSYACNGAAGSNGASGSAGATSLTSVDAEAAGANCSNGGSRITSGLDANGNGTLEPSEVSSSAYVCNGIDASLAWTSVTSGPVTMQANRGYVAQGNSTRVRFTLPANPAVGDSVRVVGAGARGWEIQPAAAQWVDTTSAGADAKLLGTVMQNFRALPQSLGGSCALTPDGRRLVSAAGLDVTLSVDGGLSTTETLLSGTGTVTVRLTAWSADGSTLLLGNSTGGRELFRVANDGRTLAPLSVSAEWWDAALSRDGQVMLAATGDSASNPGLLYLSRDRGATWSTVNGSRLWRSVSMSDDGRVMLATAYFSSTGSAPGGLYLSTDSGVNWQQVGTDPGGITTAVTPDGQHLVAWGHNGGLTRSSDGGATWVSLPGPEPTGVGGGTSWGTRLKMSADGTTLIVSMANSASVGSSATVRLYRSDDGGTSWVALSQTSTTAIGTGCLALSSDGTTLLVNDASNNLSLLSTPERYASTTRVGSAGLLRASQYGAVELQYVGSGRWLLLSHRGALLVQ